MKRKLCFIGMILAILLLVALTAGKLFWRKPETSPKQATEKVFPIKDFTCASLREQLSQEADVDADGILSEKELRGVTKLELEYADSDSLNFQELGHFPNLRELKVTIEKQTGNIVLDEIAHVTNLTICCYDKKKKGRSVVVRNIPQLEKLSMELYSASRIGIEKCSSLDDICCETNVSALSVSDLERLEKLWVLYAEKLKNFQYENINNLKELIVTEAHPIKEIDLSGLDKLERFDWNWGSLEKIIWGKKENLLNVDIHDNNFQGVLDLDKDMPASLSGLYCGDNKITEIVSKKKKGIADLQCANNKLRKIDLSHNTELLYLDCTGNENVEVSLWQKAYGDMGYFFDKSAKVHYKWG